LKNVNGNPAGVKSVKWARSTNQWAKAGRV